MTPPASIDVMPIVALIAVAMASATNIPPTCSTRSNAAPEPTSRRNSIAPTRTSAMFPTCWPSRLPSGNGSLPIASSALMTSSAISTAGHQRSPHR